MAHPINVRHAQGVWQNAHLGEMTRVWRCAGPIEIHYNHILQESDPGKLALYHQHYGFDCILQFSLSRIAKVGERPDGPTIMRSLAVMAICVRGMIDA
jgi:hypothetical protein